MKPFLRKSAIVTGSLVAVFGIAQVIAVMAWRGAIDRGFWEVFLGLGSIAALGVAWAKTGRSPFVLAARGFKQLHLWSLAAEAARIQLNRSIAVAAVDFARNYPATAQDVMSRETVR